MRRPLITFLASVLLCTAALAQPQPGGRARGDEHAGPQSLPRLEDPRGPDVRRQRDDLRSLIREQRHPEHLQSEGGEREPPARQLSPEERQALREQLRRQRAENWPRQP